jgi:hypothetical protein
MKLLDPLLQNIPPCPWLPALERPLDASITRRHGASRGALFYHDALAYAQSNWQSGRPAQAVLQLNKAWMAALEDPRVLLDFPPPYRALVWLLHHAASGHHGFLGNPVRHFQHLASRLRGPHTQLRTWRAWACFHLAIRALEGRGFPQDGIQLARSGLWLPAWQCALTKLTKFGWPGEADEARRAMADGLTYASSPSHQATLWTQVDESQHLPV